jgi:2-oxoisovalerate dehydrogenase E1 component
LNKDLLKKALLIRKFEQKLLELFSEGKLNGTVHTCVGQELIPIIAQDYLRDADMIFSNHRGHGHFIAHCGKEIELMKEILGRNDGISCGIGGSQHLKTDNFISNGIQGGLSSVAAGYSFANEEGISVCYIGDGTLGEGQFYESLILAKIFDSKVLYIIENNGYAQSTKSTNTINGDLEQRFIGFGINYFKSNIWDIENLQENMNKAVEKARLNQPTILEVECYRLNSHSKGDDNRSKEEISFYEEKDLINVFKNHNPIEYDAIEAETNLFIENILDQINKLPEPGIEYKQTELVDFFEVKTSDYQIEENQNIRINKLINKGLDKLLSNNAFLIGEDICDTTDETPHVYGGAFKVTNGLSTKYPKSVFNTSISEAGIVGFGLGISLTGKQAIVEIMFGDFLTLTFDQILQQVSKIKFMYGSEIKLPLIVRTPMGARRGYGPTHSQNIEKHFLFLPGINCLALNCLSNPEDIYKKIGFKKDFYLVIEDKVSYTKPLLRKSLPGYDIKVTDEDFPTYCINPKSTQANLVIFTYGAMLEETISAIDELLLEDIIPCIVCPTSLSPINLDQLEKSLKTSRNLLFIEEGSRRTSLSSEVIAALNEHKVDYNLVGRVSNENIIPCDKRRELKFVPNSLNLHERIIEIVNGS